MRSSLYGEDALAAPVLWANSGKVSHLCFAAGDNDRIGNDHGMSRPVGAEREVKAWQGCSLWKDAPNIFPLLPPFYSIRLLWQSERRGERPENSIYGIPKNSGDRGEFRKFRG